MNFLDFINYDILLRVLRHVLSISAGIGLYRFIQRLVIRSQCDDKGNKKLQKASLDKKNEDNEFNLAKYEREGMTIKAYNEKINNIAIDKYSFLTITNLSTKIYFINKYITSLSE